MKLANIKISLFLLLLLGSHSQARTQILVDSLIQSTQGVMIGGEFDSAGGWMPVEWSDMLIYDLGDHILSGRMEIDIRNFDPATQNSESRHHILSMFSDSLGDHNSPLHIMDGSTEHSVWDVHTGTNYDGGLKLLTSAGNKLETYSLNHVWNKDSTYHFTVIWDQYRVDLLIDSVLILSNTNIRNYALRYLFVGRDFTHSLDINTGRPNNEYSAQIGPIYSNLAVYADSVLSSLETGDTGSVDIDLPNDAGEIYSFDVTISYDSTLWEFDSIETDSSGNPLNIYYNSVSDKLFLGAFSPNPIDQLEDIVTARFTPKFDTTQVRIAHLDVTRFIVNEDSKPLFSNTYVLRPEGYSPTPIEMVLFQAQEESDGSVRLTWQTASESGNLGFEVQRGESGGSFERIAFVPGNGTSNLLNSYEFTDNELKPGHYYYRLKQIDFDGSFEFSYVVEVVLDVAGLDEFRLFDSYPNPFRGKINIIFTIPSYLSKENVQVSVYDLRGRLVKRLSPGIPSNNFFHILWDTNEEVGSRPATGVYFLTLKAGQFRASQKILFVR